MSFNFSVLIRVQGSVSIKAPGKANIWLHAHEIAVSHVSKFLNLNVSGTRRDVAHKDRFDRFSSVGDQIHATPAFQHAWATPRHTVTGCS